MRNYSQTLKKQPKHTMINKISSLNTLLDTAISVEFFSCIFEHLCKSQGFSCPFSKPQGFGISEVFKVCTRVVKGTRFGFKTIACMVRLYHGPRAQLQVACEEHSKIDQIIHFGIY